MDDTALDARDDWSLLHAVSECLGLAESMEASLRALLLPAPDPEAAQLGLWTLDEAETTATCLAVLPATQVPTPDDLGLPLPIAQLLAHPGLPIFLLPDDPRLTATTREAWATHTIAAALGLPLVLRGRVIGVLTIHWTRPVALDPRAHRIYRALAPHAARLLDTHVVSERHRVSLAAWHRERRLYDTVLDHVPVGILCIEGPTRRPLLTNRMARVMLAGDPTPVSEPLPLAYMLHPGTDQPVLASELAGVRAAITGERQVRDLDLLPPGGPRMSVETIGVPVLDADGAVDQVVVVMADITGRKHVAEERARLQQAVIDAQATALIERSTPLIPITDDVLVMPLIGTIDHARGQGILDVALQGARDRRARVTILDITGVPTLDTQAAAVLTRTAQALRLLGVEPVLSGVRPAVAQTLIELGVSLAGIVTCGSLQAAIEHALRRPGKRS